MAGFLPGIVVDSFEHGRGQLDAWLLWFFRVAHAEGPHVDRSEIQRYLAEIVWCPLALKSNPQLRFRELSAQSVRVNAFDEQTYVDLLFDANGDIRGARSLTRFRGTEMEPWEGCFSDYRDFQGLRLPAFGEVWWEGEDGRFVYWRANVTAVELLATDT